MTHLINGLRTQHEEALALLVGKREWPAFRAAALLATADLPPETTQLAAALLEAALEGLTPGHGATLAVDEDGCAYLIPRLAGLERQAAKLGIEAQSLAVYAGDEFEWDPFSGAAPQYLRVPSPPAIPTGTLAELLGDVIRREPMAEYVAWRRSGSTWIVERMSAEHMEVLRLSAPQPQSPELAARLRSRGARPSAEKRAARPADCTPRRGGP